MSLEKIFSKREPTNKKGKGKINNDGTVHIYEKEMFLSGKLGDLESLGKELHIRNLLNPGEIVRKITFSEEEVIIDIMDGKPLKFSKDTEVYYEPWFLDRGSYRFDVPEHGLAVLATEFDPVIIV